MKSPDPNAICLECGLCCNGVIFAKGQLQPEDDATKLRSLGLRLPSNRNSKIHNQKFLQPCSAFEGCRCKIYGDRPRYCRDFDCRLLQSVKAGDQDVPTALRMIRKALKLVKTVRRLLRELGDTDETVPLSKRFRRTQVRIESGPVDAIAAAQYSELTLAFHNLNMLLAQAFYPG